MSDQSPSYAEVLKDRVSRDALAAAGPGDPQPDTPTGDAKHLNTALNPAPEWKPQPERIPVPVINDPGLVGGGFDLGVLNRAYRDGDMERESPKGSTIQKSDDTKGSEGNADAIKAAAEARAKERDKKVDEVVDKAVKDTKAGTKS